MACPTRRLNAGSSDGVPTACRRPRACRHSEAVAIGAVLIINTMIGFAMELCARGAMEAILGLDVPDASVVRAGHLRTKVERPRFAGPQARGSRSWRS